MILFLCAEILQWKSHRREIICIFKELTKDKETFCTTTKKSRTENIIF
jgi:16S rRNA C1402 (ribose-2'-O) methylase RsmI